MKQKTTFLLLRKSLTFLFMFGFLILYTQELKPRFKTFHQGIPFASITIDQDKNIWAGTDKKGLFFMDQKEIIGEQQPTFKLLPIGEFVKLSDLRIQSLAADQSGNVWVGHAGINFNNVQGGLERIEVRSKKVTHLYPDRDTRGIGFMERDGLATLNSQQVVVDKNNKVWVAHKSHSIFSGASPGSPGDFILTPGTFSSRRADDYQGKFNSISTWQDRREGNEDPHLPYPAYTYNPGPLETPQARNLQSIATDNNFVWVSVFPYEAHETGGFFPTRLLQYTLDGVFVKETTIQQAGFSGGVFNGIYSNNKELWATSSFVDGGFSVYKDEEWHKINSNDLFPAGTRFNQGAIWGDEYNRVYLGTNNGLIVYDGIGPVQSVGSYTLYTKDSCNPSVVRCIKDIDMLSNNIISGISEKSIEETIKGYYSWIATDKGVMRSFFSSGEMTVYHVKDKRKPFDEDTSSEGVSNYTEMVELRDARGTDLGRENAPIFAADGTTSSVFRYWTDNVKEFYTDEDRVFYKIINKSSTEDLTEEEYTARYGKITKKELDQYVKGTTVKPEDLKYVDLILEHPSYIEEDDFAPGKNYADFDFIIEWGEKGNTIRVFEHPVRVSLPPILLAHGVWTSTASLDKLERFLLTKGYSYNEIVKVWRDEKEKAENSFKIDAYVIPSYIDTLRDNAVKSKVSAGKVNVIAHSRGGLYTRAYIEEISDSQNFNGTKIEYNNDINSLITLNTPHAGSPLASLVMDKRIAIPEYIFPELEDDYSFLGILTLNDVNFVRKGPYSLGDLFDFPVPKEDRKDNWGAKNLVVAEDYFSGSYSTETTFIKDLNHSDNLLKLKKAKVPIHVVSTDFNICKLNSALCYGNFISKPTKLTKTLARTVFFLRAIDFLFDLAPRGVDGFMKYVHGNEDNDFIVPKSSMEAGLKGDYVSTFKENIAHSEDIFFTGMDSYLNSSGVTTNASVHSKIFNLLKDDLRPGHSKYFTLEKLDPPALFYNFLPGFEGFYYNRRNQNLNSKIVIDPNSFSSAISSGDEATFDVYQENLDEIMILYEYPGLEEVYLYTTDSLNFKNAFSFTVPEEFFGEFSITAYGFSNRKLVAQHIVKPAAQLVQGVTLKNIRFSSTKDVRMYEKDNYSFDLLGTFSDGVERRINDLSGVEIIIKNLTILESVDVQTLKALTLGETTFKAKVGLLTTSSINIKVEKNPVLYRSLITNFYPEYEKTGPIKLNWETYHEYESKDFTLERSENNDQNFVEINKQQGKGTLYDPSEYSFEDNTSSDHVFYRLNLYNLDNEIVYTQIIEVDRSTLSIEEEYTLDKKGDELTLAPNPLKSSTGSLFLQSNSTDKNAILNIYDMTGKLIYTKNCAIIQGKQKIDFEILSEVANGVYIIQLKTKNYVKSLKLLLQR